MLSSGERYPSASYLPRDGEDKINFQYAAERYPAMSFRPKHYSQFLPAVSDIKFHEPSRKLLLACTSRDRGIGISQMEPKSQTPSDDRPSWVLEGECSLPYPLPSHFNN